MKSLVGRIVILLAMASCARGPAEPTTTPEGPLATPTVAASPTATPVPSLLLITGEDPQQFESALQDWAQEQGWLLQSRGAQDLTGWSETPGLQAVVEIGSGLTADELASAAPGTLLVTVDHAAAQPGDRLSTVGGPNMRHDQAAFLAGALTGLASQSWVVAAISGGAEHDVVYMAAFQQGLKYACPRCWPEIMGAWEVTAEELQARRVDAVFVLPGADQLPTSFATNVWVVYVGEAPAGVPAERLAGSVVFEPRPLILSALEGLLAGEGGTAWPYSINSGSLLYGPMNAEAVSPARVRILEAMWQLLASGELDIGVDPVSGETQ